MPRTSSGEGVEGCVMHWGDSLTSSHHPRREAKAEEAPRKEEEVMYAGVVTGELSSPRQARGGRGQARWSHLSARSVAPGRATYVLMGDGPALVGGRRDRRFGRRDAAQKQDHVPL
jgi:hypothetical protein